MSKELNEDQLETKIEQIALSPRTEVTTSRPPEEPRTSSRQSMTVTGVATGMLLTIGISTALASTSSKLGREPIAALPSTESKVNRSTTFSQQLTNAIVPKDQKPGTLIESSSRLKNIHDELAGRSNSYPVESGTEESTSTLEEAIEAGRRHSYTYHSDRPAVSVTTHTDIAASGVSIGRWPVHYDTYIGHVDTTRHTDTKHGDANQHSDTIIGAVD